MQNSHPDCGRACCEAKTLRFFRDISDGSIQPFHFVDVDEVRDCSIAYLDPSGVSLRSEVDKLPSLIVLPSFDGCTMLDLWPASSS